VGDASFEILRAFAYGHRRVAVIEAYLDESGTHAQTSHLSVGGFCGTQDQWKKYLKKWGNRQFHAHSTPELKSRLFQAIQSGLLDGYVCSVNKKLYAQYATEHWKTGIGNGYAACTFCVASAIVQNTTDQVVFSVEDGQPNSDWIRRILEYMWHGDPQCVGRIASVALVQKNAFKQMYSADFLSHAWSTFDPIWTKKFWDTGRVMEMNINAENIQKMCSDLAVVVKKQRWEKRKQKNEEKRIR
jgi:hypothetical protein